MQFPRCHWNKNKNKNAALFSLSLWQASFDLFDRATLPPSLQLCNWGLKFVVTALLMVRQYYVNGASGPLFLLLHQYSASCWYIPL